MTKKLSVNDYVLNNLMFMKNYFARAIRNQKILIFDNEREARDEFNSITLYANDISIPHFVNWIEKYIYPEPEIWERCKTAARQYRLMEAKKKKYEYKTFRIPRELSYEIELYAERIGLPKFAAMKQTIDVAMEALDANEHKLITHKTKKGGKTHQ